jgi:hypothetical protein
LDCEEARRVRVSKGWFDEYKIIGKYEIEIGLIALLVVKLAVGLVVEPVVSSGYKINGGMNFFSA